MLRRGIPTLLVVAGIGATLAYRSRALRRLSDQLMYGLLERSSHFAVGSTGASRI